MDVNSSADSPTYFSHVTGLDKLTFAWAGHCCGGTAGSVSQLIVRAIVRGCLSPDRGDGDGVGDGMRLRRGLVSGTCVEARGLGLYPIRMWIGAVGRQL